MRLATALFFALLLVGRAAEIPAARWEGTAQIPGRDLQLVVDLAKDSTGAWIGSIIIPSLGLKGAPLTELVVKGAETSFTIKDALGGPQVGPAKLKARLLPNGKLSGEFLQAGNSAPFVLEKSGPAQVELPKSSTAVGPDFVGEWKGEYEMGGYPRQVTLKLANKPGGPAVPDFVIVGKKVNNVPVDLLLESGGFLSLESKVFGITFEGRLQKEAGEIRGSLTQGPYEASLVLHRTP